MLFMSSKLQAGNVLHSRDYPDIGIVKVEIISVDSQFYWYKYLEYPQVYPVSIDLFDMTIDRGEWILVIDSLGGVV